MYLSITILVLNLLLLPTYAFRYFWEWTPEGKYLLKLTLDRECKYLRKDDILIFLTKSGKVYKKKLSSRSCFIKKKFRNRENMKILLFQPNKLKVKHLGIINY